MTESDFADDNQAAITPTQVVVPQPIVVAVLPDETNHPEVSPEVSDNDQHSRDSLEDSIPKSDEGKVTPFVCFSA